MWTADNMAVSGHTYTAQIQAVYVCSVTEAGGNGLTYTVHTVVWDFTAPGAPFYSCYSYHPWDKGSRTRYMSFTSAYLLSDLIV